MSNSYSHAYLRIDCTLAQAKVLQLTLSFLDAQMETWNVAPESTSALTGEAANFPEWAKQFCVELAQDSFEHERDHISFEWELLLPTVQGRQVETEQGFQGLALEGNNVEDDLFVAAHLILKALNSDQLISSGTAYTADRANEHAFAGNHVTITRHGWQFVFDTQDIIAAEREASDNVSYWLVTCGTEAALWVAETYDTAGAVDFDIGILQDSLVFREADSCQIKLAKIPATAYQHLKNSIREFKCESVARRLKAHDRDAA